MVCERQHCSRIFQGNKHKLKGCSIILVSKIGLTYVCKTTNFFEVKQSSPESTGTQYLLTATHIHFSCTQNLIPLIIYWIMFLWSTCTYHILRSIVPLVIFPTVNHAWHIFIGLSQRKPPYQKFLLILELLFNSNPRQSINPSVDN